jgi:WD40 repeat protein
LHHFKQNSSLQLFANSDGTKSARFNGNGTRLLCSEVNQPLAFYGIPTGKSDKEWLYCSALGYEIESNFKVKSPCCFAGDEDELVVGASDADNSLYVWLADTNPYHRSNDRPLCVLRGHQDIIRSVRYSMRNGLLASCGEEGVIKLWSTDLF